MKYIADMLDLAPLGDAVRRARLARGLTIRTLATRSGVSNRFLSDLERGVGNISIARLAEVARALGVGLVELVAPLDGRAPDRPLALVGLRGAGKSTVGERLAARLARAFVEVDREIEAAAGLPLGQIFELHGEAYYRRLEHDVLGDALRRGAVVLAVGGGVVTDRATWGLLKREATTVWLRARPDEHYQRVMSQGDLRPMKNRPAAMAELRALLAEREPFYAESEAVVDTSEQAIDAVVEAVARIVA